MVGQARIGISLRTIRRDCWTKYSKGVLAEIFLKIDTKVEAGIDITELVTPTFSELESVAATESIDAREAIESLKSVTPPSVEEVLADSHSIEEEDSDVKDRGSTAGGLHLNGG